MFCGQPCFPAICSPRVISLRCMSKIRWHQSKYIKIIQYLSKYVLVLYESGTPTKYVFLSRNDKGWQQFRRLQMTEWQIMARLSKERLQPRMSRWVSWPMNFLQPHIVPVIQTWQLWLPLGNRLPKFWQTGKHLVLRIFEDCLQARRSVGHGVEGIMKSTRCNLLQTCCDLRTCTLSKSANQTCTWDWQSWLCLRCPERRISLFSFMTMSSKIFQHVVLSLRHWTRSWQRTLRTNYSRFQKWLISTIHRPGFVLPARLTTRAVLLCSWITTYLPTPGPNLEMSGMRKLSISRTPE